MSELLESLGGLGTPGLCLAVFLLAFGETAILLDLAVPGEVGLVVAGAAAATADHPLVAVIAAAALGAMLGDATSYAVGRRWGRGLLDRFRVTRRRFGPAVERSERYFARHGGRAVFVGRWIGALRAVVPFVAGVSRLRVRSFLAWNVAASLLWATAAVMVGATFGEPVSRAVDQVSSAVSIAAVAVLGLVLVAQHHRRVRSPS